MANKAPATVVITSTTGPGQAVTALNFADVNDLEFDFLHNIVKVSRAGSAGIQNYDLSAVTAISVVISGGLVTFTIS